MLRITGGRFKGVPLHAPQHVRATSAKVRQALYNILSPLGEGLRILDGFAGSGALGFEALSRGAAFVAFIDSAADAVISIRDTLSRLGSEVPRSAWRVMHLEIDQGLAELSASEPPFDVVLFDPPYGADEAKKALNSVVRYAILAPAGIVVIEHHQWTALPPASGPLHQFKRHRYGDTVLSFYRSVSR